MSIPYREYLLSTNKFNEPRVAKDKEAISTLLVRLILLEPGTNPLHPTMGVGLVSKYRWLFVDAIDNLKKDIETQVNQFIPNCQCGNVDIEFNDDKTAKIRITIDDTIFEYDSAKYIPITLATIKES